MYTSHRAARFFSLLLILLLLAQLLPTPALRAIAAAPAATSAPAQPCELYPIGLPAPLLAGQAPGATFTTGVTDAPTGFRWLSWSGANGVPTLAQSLRPPGNSVTYVNPDNPADRVLDAGDTVYIRPDDPNAASIRGALSNLIGVEITVPVGQPSAGRFAVSGFARVSLVEFRAPGPDRLTLRYLGPTGCGAAPSAEPVEAATDEDSSLSITLRGSRAGQVSLTFQLGAAGQGTLGSLADQSCATHDGLTTCTATVVYTPNADYHGQDAFDYTVSDGLIASEPARVALTIRPVNDSPLAADDAATLDEDASATIAVLANDQDIDGDSLSVSAVGAPAHGATELLEGGQIRYTPAPNHSGADSFGYTLSDGKGGTATAMVQVSITPINDAPQLTAQPPAIAAPEDSPAQTIVLTGADVESAADQLGITIAALPARGSLTRVDGSLVTTSDVLPNPVELLYTPAADANGDDQLRAIVTDGGEAPSAPLATELTVSIALDPVNDAPTAADRKLEGLRRGVPVQIELSGADVDSAGLSFSIVAPPAHGQLEAPGQPQCTPAGAGSVCTATVTYTPDDNFAGTDSFSYAANDGSLSGEPATVSIATTNAAPVASPQAAGATEDTPQDIALEASDPDGDSLTFTIVAPPAHGTLTIDGATARYTPAPNYHGPDSFDFRASDGLAESVATVTIAVAPVNDAPVFGPEATNTSQTIDEGAGLVALTASDVDGDSLSFTVAEGSLPAGLTLNADGSFAGAAASRSAGSYSLVVQVDDGVGGSATSHLTVVVIAPPVQLPPDPGSVAPPVDTIGDTSIADATAFLYSGPNPIQTGVAPGTIEGHRASVLRGRVVGRDGLPIGGVTVAIKDHPEYGETLTRADGMFDLAVNGGGSLVVSYAKAGLLPVQRTVAVEWLEFASLPEVVMIQLDGAVTAVELGAGQPMQAARANLVSDADGTRRATLLFPEGVTATMVLTDGAEVPLSTLHVRATEYTVGARGLDTMPGELPANSGYTYAAELSVDEAIAAGATQVRFSEPVPFYIENFLDFPIGTVVPAGYFDRQKGQWIGSDNGRVIKILAETDGLASLDIDGSGVAAAPSALAALGIGEAELAQLAQLYEPGQSLWRTPVPHFTPWDCNFPWGPPEDALKPNQQELNGEQDDPDENAPIEDDELRCGSVIGCMNQTLGERIPLVGTPYNLYYQSDRASGYQVGRAIEIPLSGPALPSTVRAIKLEVSVAGQVFKRTFAPAPNQRYTYVWDGKDVYGRPLQGRQTISVRVGYEYPAVYYFTTEDFARVWARVAGAAYSTVVRNRQAESITIWQDWKGFVGSWTNRSLGADGWDLDIHHSYNPASQLLLMGDGRQRSGVSLDAMVVHTVAGDPAARQLGDGGPALRARVIPRDVVIGPDGSLYFTEYSTQRVRKVSPDGIITTIAGNGQSGFSGDGGPATQAKLNFPYGIDLGPDGSVYFADMSNNRIRKISPDGIITTVAGNGQSGFAGDNGPATQAQLRRPEDVAVAPDGSIYIADTDNLRIRKVNPDGAIFTIAGTTSVFLQNGPAYFSAVGEIHSIALGPDGSLYIAGQQQVRRITTAGIISTVAGRGSATSSGDGGPAILANITSVSDITVDKATGDLYIAELQRVRRVRSGIINTIAGNGQPCIVTAVDCPEGALAAATRVYFSGALTVGADGAIYMAEFGATRIRRIAPLFPKTTDGSVLIPAEHGRELYRFLANGRHVETIDSLTNAVIYSFAYDAAGRLSSVTDRNGRVTTIERDAQGRPIAIVAPNGRRTQLTVNGAGELERVVLPDSATYLMGYRAGALLTSFTNPVNAVSRFDYDDRGRLISDLGPDGAGVTLARTVTNDGFRIALTTTLGRTTTYEVERLKTGDLRITTTHADGTRTVELRRTNGSEVITAADGTVTETMAGPDPRWGMVAPVTRQMTRRSPDGIVSTMTSSRSAELADWANPLSLVSATETVAINGQAQTTSYDAAARRLTITSAAGRTATITLDERARVIEAQAPGSLPVTYTYDDLGRPRQISQGPRTWTYTYDQFDQVIEARNPLNHVAVYGYDSAGRVTTLTREDSTTVTFDYDDNGNLEAITPAGRPAHTFEYTDAGLVEAYVPPSVNGVSDRVEYIYSLDREPTLVSYADGRAIELGYAGNGHLESRSHDGATTSLSYDPATGNLSAMSDAAGGLSYTYDGALLESSTWAGAVAGSVGWSYTPDLLVQSVSVNGANPIAYGYDADLLLTAAGALSLTRSPQTGQIESSTLGGVATSVSYDDFSDLETTAATFNGATLYAVEYTRDDLGRIATRTETIGGQSVTYEYVYDEIGQLTDVKQNGAVVASYAYDDNGNRTGVTTAGGSVAAIYDDQDRLVQRGATTYAYRSDGTLLQTVTGGQVTSYTYDAAGNLRGVTLPDGTQISYLVDSQDRRIGKQVNGALVQGFLYDGQLQPVAELDASGAVVSRFVYGTRPNVPEYMVKNGATYRIISDERGSPRLVVNSATGEIAQRMDYDVWGNVTHDSNPGFQPFGFAGGLYDRDTGLLRFGARDYAPESGRWTAKDPIGFAGGQTNLYVYVGNDPVNAYDPSGLFNYGKGGAALVNFLNAGRLGSEAAGKLLAAIVTAETGVGAVGFGLWAVWNFKSAQTAFNRGVLLWNEALNEDSSRASVRNMCGVLPLGDRYDEEGEPGPQQFWQEQAQKLGADPLGLLVEIGVLSP